VVAGESRDAGVELGVRDRSTCCVDCRAGMGETERDAAPDTAAGACDQCDTSIEIGHTTAETLPSGASAVKLTAPQRATRID